MQVFKDIDRLPVFKKAVITIGTFDGVHVGHVQIIKQLLQEAELIGGTPVLITFFPHPKQVIALMKNPLFLLNTPEEKYELLNLNGITNIVVVPFDKQFSSQPAKTYISKFLVDKFHPHTIIIGYDHRFGNNREGDYHLLEDQASRFEYNVIEIPEHVLKDITISSTGIRKALLSGDINTASSYLGYDYFFTAVVVEGDKLGRTIGYPTANLQVIEIEKLIPANGVYAVEVVIEGDTKIHKGMMNIGIRPTIGGQSRVIEVNIFGLDNDLYGLRLKISLKKWLRKELKFNGVDQLKEQLEKDKANAMLFFDV